MKKIIPIFCIFILCFCIVDASSFSVMEIDSLIVKNIFRYHSSSGNGLDEEWNKTFGGSMFDVGLSVKLSLDGGYIISGVIDARGWDSVGDGYLIKTDSDGNMEWEKTFGGPRAEKCGDISLTTDEGYILTGMTTSFGAGDMDLWLIKTDSNGNEDWNKTFGGSDNDQGVSVQQTSDNGYIIAGSTRSYGAGGSDGWLIKTDSNGNEDWNKTFGDSIGGEYLMSVQQTNDGGYIGTGRNYLDNSWTSSNVLVIKTDSNGEVQWNKPFIGGPFLDSCLWIQQTIDGGYILTGQSQIYSSDEEEDISLIKIDSNGNEEWSKYFGEQNSFDSGTSVEQTQDGGFISTGFISNDAVLIKTDIYGNTEWSVTFGGTEIDEGFEVHQTSDRGYIVCGFTKSYGNGNRDVWLVKFAAFENSRPNKPSCPSGPTNGNINTEYTYTCIGTDLDEDVLFYLFDWDDGSDSGWLGPYESGETCEGLKIWETKGDYEIKVKARDINGGESEWSNPLVVCMPYTINSNENQIKYNNNMKHYKICTIAYNKDKLGLTTDVSGFKTYFYHNEFENGTDYINFYDIQFADNVASEEELEWYHIPGLDKLEIYVESNFNSFNITEQLNEFPHDSLEAYSVYTALLDVLAFDTHKNVFLWELFGTNKTNYVAPKIQCTLPDWAPIITDINAFVAETYYTYIAGINDENSDQIFFYRNDDTLINQTMHLDEFPLPMVVEGTTRYFGHITVDNENTITYGTLTEYFLGKVTLFKIFPIYSFIRREQTIELLN